MRLLLLTLLLVTTDRYATAQPLLDTLAVRVCDCMGATPEIVYPRLQANRCVSNVSTAYASRIRTELQLSSRKASDRRRLSELLIDPLTEYCPQLKELGPGVAEPQLSYSDRKLVQQSTAAGAKWPAANASSVTTRAGREEDSLTGTLTELPTGDQLRLLLPDGRVVTLLLPRGLLRRYDFVRGQSVTVVYREDWRTDGREILPTVVRIID